jgi:deoxycytidylate deaminase
MIHLMREDDDIYQGHINKLREYASDRRITQKKTQGIKVPFQNHVAMIIGPRGRTLSLGRNKLKTHPIQAYWAKRLGKDHKIYLHAETDALIKAMNKHGGPESVYDTDILVVRFNKDGDTVSSKPCIICRHMLQAHGLRHVFHT